MNESQVLNKLAKTVRASFGNNGIEALCGVLDTLCTKDQLEVLIKNLAKPNNKEEVMTNLIINTMDGTVCEFTGTVIVEVETLDEAGKALLQEWVDGGNDGTASELGEKYGVPLEKFTDNELTYANTIAFSGKALREEVRDRLDSGFDNNEYKFAIKFTDEQFEELGQYILQSDYLWNIFNEELSSGIRGYANDVLKELL